MDLIGFALAVLLIELTPGPNMGWLVALTLADGRRAGLAAMVGIAAGLACNAALSVLAASLLLGSGAVLAQGVAVMGAAMMAWLAWEAGLGRGLWETRERSPSRLLQPVTRPLPGSEFANWSQRPELCCGPRCV